jgi:hypothetical protein
MVCVRSSALLSRKELRTVVFFEQRPTTSEGICCVFVTRHHAPEAIEDIGTIDATFE